MDTWHKIRFHLNDDFSDSTTSIKEEHFELLIIDLIIRKVIDKFIDNIALWRLHRRFGPERHFVTLIIYSEKSIVADIFSEINSDYLINNLVNDSILKINPEWIEEDTIDSELTSDISATSDSNWPSKIKSTWPYLAQSVSINYMELLRKYVNDPIESLRELQTVDLLIRYKEVLQIMNCTLREWLSHAYFHQIYAIFGYPIIRTKIRDLNNQYGMFEITDIQ